MSTTAEIRYGKSRVSFYRTHAAPLRGVTPIPESAFRGRDNALLAAEVDVDVLGERFLAAYTDGDNRSVVATDTLKNFVHAIALEFDGPTLEGFAALLGRRLLATYPQMEALRIRAREIPFAKAGSPDASGPSASGMLFRRSGDDAAVAELDLARADGGAAIVTAARSGREDLRLLKLTGSSFTRFVRDDYTTLPEIVDRPLLVHLDAHWRYGDLGDAVGDRIERYVHADQARDLLECVFDEFDSRSIQHLVHEMGRRMLARFPQLGEVSFDAQNRTPDAARVSQADEKVRVYTDPQAAYGRIGLVLRR